MVLVMLYSPLLWSWQFTLHNNCSVFNSLNNTHIVILTISNDSPLNWVKNIGRGIFVSIVGLLEFLCLLWQLLWEWTTTVMQDLIPGDGSKKCTWGCLFPVSLSSHNNIIDKFSITLILIMSVNHTHFVDASAFQLVWNSQPGLF